MIDSRHAFAYIAALALAVGLVFTASPANALSSEYRHDLGAALPKYAAKIGEHRYRSPWNWDDTMRWLWKTYPVSRFPRIRIVNQPGIKAIHLRNRRDRGWSGFNIYEINDGEVRFYVLPAKHKKKTSQHVSK